VANEAISLDRLPQRPLIAIGRHQVVAALIADLTANVPLARLGVDADQQALDIQSLEPLPDGGDRITLGRDLFPADNKAQLRRQGTEYVNGRLTAAAQATHRLPIDRNAAFQDPDHLGDPATERHLELLRVQHQEDP
jgi:hypothetical protein